MVAVVPGAGADPEQKLYAAEITPHTVAAGASVAYTLQVVNEAKQQLGSMNLSIPGPFTVESTGQPVPGGTASIAGNVIELRGLAIPPGGSMTVGFQAEAPCQADTFVATSIAKQSNDFQGPPGNNFILDEANSDLTVTVTGSCSLAFTAPPADTVEAQNITADPFTPGGDPVQVEVRTSGGERVKFSGAPIELTIGTNPTGGSLSGTTAVSADHGVATFDALAIDTHGLAYTLVAATTDPNLDIDSGVSGSFDIVDDGRVCQGGHCSASSETATTFGSVSTESSVQGDLIDATLGVTNLDCAAYVEPGSDTLVFDYTGSGTKTATYTIDASVVDRPVSKFQACYASPNPFVTRDGTQAEFQEAIGLYVGLLPTCSKKNPQPPCLLSKSKDRQGNVTLKVLAPDGDPQIH